MTTNQSDKEGNEIFIGDLLQVPANPWCIDGVHKVFMYEDKPVTANNLFSNRCLANKRDLEFMLKIGSTKIKN